MLPAVINPTDSGHLLLAVDVLQVMLDRNTERFPYFEDSEGRLDTDKLQLAVSQLLSCCLSTGDLRSGKLFLQAFQLMFSLTVGLFRTAERVVSALREPLPRTFIEFCASRLQTCLGESQETILQAQRGLIQALVANGEVPQAFEMLRREACAKDVKAFNIIIRFLAESGDLEGAAYAVGLMEANGVSLDERTYMLLLQLHLAKRDVIRARTLLERMRVSGFPLRALSRVQTVLDGLNLDPSC